VQAKPAASPVGRKKIAVLPFDYSAVQGQWGENPINIGEGLSEMLVTELVKSGAYLVVERAKLKEILKEQKLEQTEVFDQETAVRIGRLVGVNAVICGSVTRFGTERVTSTVSTGGTYGGVDGTRSDRQTAVVGLDVRMIDTESAVILTAMSGKGEDRRSFSAPRWSNYQQGGLSFGDISQDLVGSAGERAVVMIADQLVEYADSLPRPAARGLVADVDANSVTVNLGTEQGLKSGGRLVAEKLVREVRDPANKEIVLRRICRAIAFLTITEIDSRSCVATVDSLVPGERLEVGQEVRPVTP
jgi:curli biogenesis system outer membrane secretion channel CsgG